MLAGIVPTATPASSSAPPSFLNLFNVLMSPLSSDAQVSPSPQATVTTNSGGSSSPQAASSGQIADALIRAMLGAGSGTTPFIATPASGGSSSSANGQAASNTSSDGNDPASPGGPGTSSRKSLRNDGPTISNILGPLTTGSLSALIPAGTIPVPVATAPSLPSASNHIPDPASWVNGTTPGADGAAVGAATSTSTQDASARDSVLPYGATVISNSTSNDLPNGTSTATHGILSGSPSSSSADLAFGLHLTPLTAPESSTPEVAGSLTDAGTGGTSAKDQPAAGSAASAMLASATSPSPQGTPATPVQQEASLGSPLRGSAASPAVNFGNASRASGAVVVQTSKSLSDSAQDSPGNESRKSANGQDSQPRVSAIASTAGSADSLGGNPMPAFVVRPPTEGATPANAAPAAEPTLHAASDTVQASEPISSANNAPAASPATSPIQQIVVRIARPDAQPVDLQISQRAGEVNVSVRTPDTGLQSSLRQDLGTLVNSLERSGYQAETITPHGVATRATISTETNSNGDRQESSSNSGGRGGSEITQRKTAARSTSAAPAELAEGIGETSMSTAPINGVNGSSAPASSTSNPQNAAANASTSALGNEDVFLQLLVAQLKNQDPENPADGTAFVTQLAQFTTLGQTTQGTSDLDSMLKLMQTSATPVPAATSTGAAGTSSSGTPSTTPPSSTGSSSAS